MQCAVATSLLDVGTPYKKEEGLLGANMDMMGCFLIPAGGFEDFTHRARPRSLVDRADCIAHDGGGGCYRVSGDLRGCWDGV